MRKHLLVALSLCWICSAGFGFAADASPFEGRWKLDPARSSSVRPWVNIALEITPKGKTVELKRTLFWTIAKQGTELLVVQPDDHTVTDNPAKYWFDSAYNNAYIGGDHQQHIKAGWLDGGRILRLEITLSLEMQQGDYPVHIYREYRLSADHNTLKVYELRSTRDQALTFTYTRA
jgi:hypothetical protein